MTLYIGLDLGIKTGWAFVESDKGVSTHFECGEFVMTKYKEGDRWVYFNTRLAGLFRGSGVNLRKDIHIVYEYVPRHLGIKAAHAYGGFKAMLEFSISLVREQGANVSVSSYVPTEIKKFATGKGNANKEEMMLVARYDKPEYLRDNQTYTDNTADAVWTLECGLDALKAK